jgi:hypothetical protein
MPSLIYRRCKKHETQLRYHPPWVQVFYNSRQIAVYKASDIYDLIHGQIKQPKLIKECKDES